MQSYWNPEVVYAATVFFHNQALHNILYCSVARSGLSSRGRHLCYLAMRVMRESVGGAKPAVLKLASIFFCGGGVLFLMS